LVRPMDYQLLRRLRDCRVVLASQSPRRRVILSMLDLPDMEVVPSGFAEDIPKAGLTALEYVMRTAEAKALDVYRKQIENEDDKDHRTLVVISADTVVLSFGGDVLEKPRGADHHFDMLRVLRDAPGPHQVLTGVCVAATLACPRVPGYSLRTAVETTLVNFDPAVPDDLLRAYARSGDGADKAGGYGAQGLGSILVKGIDGSFDNVAGMPLRVTLKLLGQALHEADDENGLAGTDPDGEGDGF